MTQIQNDLEMCDIQGFIIRGYKRMQYANYLLLQITNAADAKKWISEISEHVTTAVHHEETNCLNFAITCAGLVKLGLHDKNLENFSSEFRDGMNEAHRSRLLGDLEGSAPGNWEWGGKNAGDIHIMLMLFGTTAETMQDYLDMQTADLEGNGLKLVKTLEGQTLPENKEHFGFRDGISQPVIKGSGRSGPVQNMVNAGEFILGYKNEYGVYPESPLIEDKQGNENLLPEDADTGIKDLGRNGSYMVFRQIQQHVDRFWQFMNKNAKDEKEATFLAAKMVGRWPSGAPLVKFPDSDPGGTSDDNDFGYRHEDPDGLKCPFGSHLRRCNPRNDFEDTGTSGSLAITNRHRLIRRARLYGKPFAGSATNYNPEGEVGLHFICFQSNIAKQFEFVQHTWANYPNFAQLYDDPDPLIGVRETALPGYTQNFTIQSKPVNKSIIKLEPFTSIKGGAYFFFPGISAMRYLATI